MTVQRRELNWLELVQKAHGKDWTEREDAYQFTGRTFKERAQVAPVVTVTIDLSFYADDYADSFA